MFKSISLTKNIGFLSSLLLDNDRKSIPILVKEFTSMIIKQKCIPMHYFSRFIYKKDCENIFDFLPDKFLYKIKSKFNDPDVIEVLENKLYFDLFYRQFGISLPKILMYNHKKMFVVGNRTIEVNNSHDFKLLLSDLISENSQRNTIFIKRTSGSYGGDRIYKISCLQLSVDEGQIDNLYREVAQSGYLFQETIPQHPKMDRLNPSCINTIRFDTFIDNTGKVEIISAHIRMSISDLCVDNIGSGGCSVLIDLNTGKLHKYGYTTLSKSGGELLTEHPVTKTVFENFEIPDFVKAKELVLKVASYMPGLRLIGWDVGLGISGPVLIEGNSDYDITGGDLMYRGLRSNSVFRKALEEIGYV